MAGGSDCVLSFTRTLRRHILSVRSNAFSTSAISLRELDVLTETGYILYKEVGLKKKKTAVQVIC